MKPPLRLRKRPQFLAMRSGARIHGACFVLELRQRAAGETADEQPRFGFTVTKKTGNSVVRNRIRRRLREAVRLCAADAARPQHDYVLVGKPAALRAQFPAIVAEIARRLSQKDAARHRASQKGLDQTGRNKANPTRTHKQGGAPV